MRVPSAHRPKLLVVETAVRHAPLEEFQQQVSGCTRCRLAEGRTQVVFGVGDPQADLMFVGEAPGFHEDKQGYPFVGQAGKLLDKLLAGIGLDARRRLHRERRSSAGRPATATRSPTRSQACEPLPLPADRADPAEGDRDARQLRDQAAQRQGRPASPACTGSRRRSNVGGTRGAAVPALPPGGGALHAGDAQGARGGLRPPARAARPRRCRSPRPSCRCSRRLAAPEPTVQLGLF